MSRVVLLLALTLALTLALGACAQPRPSRLGSDDPVPLGSRDAEGVAAWLEARGHPPVGEHRAVLSESGWAGRLDRQGLLERWEQWWAEHLDAATVAERRAGLEAALASD